MNLNLWQPFYQTIAYGLNIPPMENGVPHGPVPDVLFPRTPAPNMLNVRPKGDMTNGVREQIARMLREFGFTLKGRTRVYQKPYHEYFDTIPYPRSFRMPDFAKSIRDDTKMSYEHISQFLAQINYVGMIDAHKIRLFPLSLSGTAFNWFTLLPPNSNNTWR
jgi:hypothetical protein